MQGSVGPGPAICLVPHGAQPGAVVCLALCGLSQAGCHMLCRASPGTTICLPCLMQGLLWVLLSATPCVGLARPGASVHLVLSELSQASPPPVVSPAPLGWSLSALSCLGLAECYISNPACGLGGLGSALLSEGCLALVWVGGHQPTGRFPSYCNDQSWPCL